MQFKVNTSEFKAAFIKAEKATVSKHSLPCLANVMISAVNGRCRLSASNLIQFLSISIPAYVPDQHDIAFVFQDTKQVLKAVKLFNGETITFEHIPERSAVKLICGTRKAEVLVDKAEVFPEFPTVENGARFEYSAEKLAARFECVKYAVFNDDSRPVQTGIHFNGADMVSCDGYRLAMNSDDGLTVAEAITVPTNALKLASDVLRGDINIIISKKYIAFEDHDSTIISRLLEGEYFNYRGAIPTNENRITVNVKDFADNLKYLKTFETSERQPVTWNDKRLIYETSTGRFECEFDMTGHFDFTIGFNMNYMLDALGQFKESKTLEILMPESNLRPMILQQGGNLALVLPFRLKNEDPDHQKTEDVA